tara:strand:- start:578 stop:1084 length:507 start_codon:yes stop_codon:yes gene_type:complete
MLPKPMELGSFNLINHQGKPFQFEDLENHWSLIFFGYTQCPDVCPSTIFKLKQIYDLLDQNQKLSKLPQVIFISVDPERDNPETLSEYLTFFDPEFIGITGDQSEIKKITSAMSVYYEKAEQNEDSDSYVMHHTASIFLTNEEGRLVASFRPTASAEELTKDIKKILL